MQPFLHGGQVDVQVEQVPDPGPAYIVGGGASILGLETALPADPPGAAGTEASELIALPHETS